MTTPDAETPLPEQRTAPVRLIARQNDEFQFTYDGFRFFTDAKTGELFALAVPGRLVGND